MVTASFVFQSAVTEHRADLHVIGRGEPGSPPAFEWDGTTERSQHKKYQQHLQDIIFLPYDKLCKCAMYMGRYAQHSTVNVSCVSS